MKSIILISLLGVVFSAPARPYQPASRLDDGSYQFFYETGQDAGDQFRSEVRGPDGVVVGKYSYTDPNGEKREVNYRAGNFGYVAKGDVSVAGAPKGQFPVEEPKKEPNDRKEDTNAVKEEEKGKDDSNQNPDEESRDPGEDDEDYELDEVQGMKIKQPDENAPPDGFPVGFFGEHFTGMRRLPEPVKDNDDDEKKDDKGISDIAGRTKNVINHQEPVRTFNEMPALFPFANFEPQSWPVHMPYVSNFHQPVYVYSYQHPEAHGYYYFY